MTRVRRTAAERNRSVEAKRPGTPTVAILPGPAPMTARLAEIIRAMVDRQRARERG